MTTLSSATSDDLDDLVALHLDTVGVAHRDFSPPKAIMPSAAVLRGLWLEDIEGTHDVSVAIDDGAIIGSVVARARGDVARLHIHPARRG